MTNDSQHTEYNERVTQGEQKPKTAHASTRFTLMNQINCDLPTECD